MTKAVKATRKLSEFNFDYEGAAVALVGPSVGGAANGRTTLLTKSLKGITGVEVEKASEVTVTMSMVDFLCKFFGLWYDDAIVLATIFGYESIEDHANSYHDHMQEYDEHLQERVDAVQIMKSLVLDKSLDEIKKAVGELSPKDYLEVLKTQELFEKNFEEASAKVASIKKSSAKEGVTVSKEIISPSVEIRKQEEDSMSEFITKAVHETAIEEAVKKAKYEAVVELQKAKDELKALKDEKLQAVAKARKEAIAEVEKDEAKAEELVKSLEAVSDEAFDVIVKSLKTKEEKLEDSDLFVQKSKNTEVEKDEVNGTRAILEKKYQKQ